MREREEERRGEMEKGIAERVKKVVASSLSIEEGQVVETARFAEDLGADSLDTVELVMAFEQEFSCEIPDSDAEKILTVKDAIDYLQRQAMHGSVIKALS